jgi:hypothetical protein
MQHSGNMPRRRRSRPQPAQPAGLTPAAPVNTKEKETARMPIDESFHESNHTYRLVGVYHLDRHILRIDITRDAYPQQSRAVAEILNDAKAWTTLASAPVSTWYPDTPRFADGEVPYRLRELADELLTRARTILTI